MKICGPKCSLCGLIVSVWGVIQLVVMGLFYYFQSVALFEDLPLDEAAIEDVSAFYSEVEAAYVKNAQNCWIAAGLYLITFVFSGHQFYVNSRS